MVPEAGFEPARAMPTALSKQRVYLSSATPALVETMRIELTQDPCEGSSPPWHMRPQKKLAKKKEATFWSPPSLNARKSTQGLASSLLSEANRDALEAASKFLGIFRIATFPWSSCHLSLPSPHANLFYIILRKCQPYFLLFFVTVSTLFGSPRRMDPVRCSCPSGRSSSCTYPCHGPQNEISRC